MKRKILAGVLPLVVICVLIAILAVACSSTEEAQSKAGPIYMGMVGVSQGRIEGSCTVPGHEGNITVYGLSQALTVPVSSRTGDPSGTRAHNPLTITKPLDRSSPELYQAFHQGERFSQVTIELYRTDDTGAEEHYFTIKLDSAIITSIKAHVPTLAGDDDPPTQDYGHMEEVSFTYKKITWVYEPEGIEYEETWPVSSG